MVEEIDGDRSDRVVADSRRPDRDLARFGDTEDDRGDVIGLCSGNLGANGRSFLKYKLKIYTHGNSLNNNKYTFFGFQYLKIGKM